MSTPCFGAGVFQPHDMEEGGREKKIVSQDKILENVVRTKGSMAYEEVGDLAGRIGGQQSAGRYDYQRGSRDRKQKH